MAFPDGWGRKCALVIQNGQVPANQSNFPVLLTEDTLPSEMMDADGSYPALNGGGDIRFSSDSAGSTRLACEIVDFTTNNDPANATAEIYVKIPSVSSSVDTTFYVWYNKTGESQPARNDTYGSDNVWDSNYIMVHHMDGSAYTDLDDSTSNQQDVTAQEGSPTFGASAPYGEGVDYSGTTQGHEVADSATLDLASQFTVSAYFNAGSLGSYPRLAVKAHTSNASPYTVYGLLFDASSHLRTEMATGSTQYSDTHTTTVSTGTWVYGSATYNGTTIYTYHNSTQSSGTAHTGAVATNTQDFSIGKAGYESNYFDGTIAEVRVSNIARTANWITTEVNNVTSPSTFVVEGTPETPNLSININNSITITENIATAIDTFTISGITKDRNGNTLGTCECFLCKDNGDNTASFINYTQSDESGNYTFSNIVDNDASYFVISWKDDSPHVFDVTDHVLQPVMA